MAVAVAAAVEGIGLGVGVDLGVGLESWSVCWLITFNEQVAHGGQVMGKCHKLLAS